MYIEVNVPVPKRRSCEFRTPSFAADFTVLTANDGNHVTAQSRRHFAKHPLRAVHDGRCRMLL